MSVYDVRPAVGSQVSVGVLCVPLQSPPVLGGSHAWESNPRGPAGTECRVTQRPSSPAPAFRTRLLSKSAPACRHTRNRPDGRHGHLALPAGFSVRGLASSEEASRGAGRAEVRGLRLSSAISCARMWPEERWPRRCPRPRPRHLWMRRLTAPPYWGFS